MAQLKKKNYGQRKKRSQYRRQAESKKSPLRNERPRKPGSEKPGAPSQAEYDSVAPYNFVPLPDRVLWAEDFEPTSLTAPSLPSRPRWKTHDIFVPELNSGWIDLEIVTKTPTYVRCGPPSGSRNPKETEQDRARQDFYHYGDPEHPVIPGSSVRGLVRSLFEIVSHSRIVFADRQLIFRAIADRALGKTYTDAFKSGARVSGGYLEKDRDGFYCIAPAKTYGDGKSIVRIHLDLFDRTGYDNSKDFTRAALQTAWVKSSALKTPLRDQLGFSKIRQRHDFSMEKTPDHDQEVLIVLSGAMSNKRYHSAILPKDDRAERIRIPDEVWSLYEEDRELMRGLKTRKLGKGGEVGVPLFYIRDQRIATDENREGLFFGPTLLFRIPYSKRISEHVPKDNLDYKKMDLAEAVFGRVAGRGSEERAVKGRVQFMDAMWDGNGGPPFLDTKNRGIRIPKVLSGPKPTAFQHYLAQDSRDIKELKNWSHKTPLRGFKLYWHRKGVGEPDMFEFDKSVPQTVVKDSQHTVIRPVRSGVVFRGRVKFDNLSDIELGALLTVLDLPDEMRHKIGMGKPYGMGTIKIKPTLTIVDRVRRYSQLFDDQGLHEGRIVQTDTAERCKSAFEKALAGLLHHDGNIWQIERLKELAWLLNWKSPPSLDRTDYLLGPSGKEERPNLWRERPVLPRASEVYDSKPITKRPRTSETSR